MTDFCGARNRKGQPCRRPAGWGTSHPGEGKCKLHGGASTGPRDLSGNKNALKTGEHESIFVDLLDADEVDIWHKVNTDRIAQLDEELRIITIRERRMLQRIAKLTGVDFTVVEQSYESGTVASMGKSVPFSKNSEKTVAALGQIQAIEEALTRVQTAKARLIELKHKIESEKPSTLSDLQNYREALTATAEDVWDDNETAGIS